MFHHIFVNYQKKRHVNYETQYFSRKKKNNLERQINILLQHENFLPVKLHSPQAILLHSKVTSLLSSGVSSFFQLVAWQPCPSSFPYLLAIKAVLHSFKKNKIKQNQNKTKHTQRKYYLNDNCYLFP